MADTVTLKPCPFCGGEATLIEGYWSSGSWHWPDVVCNDRKCGASKQAIDHDFCKKEAIASWNTRVQPDSALVEELRAALKVGERFLNKCTSAWSCGEPEHRVRDMLDAADDFRATLNKLTALGGSNAD